MDMNAKIRLESSLITYCPECGSVEYVNKNLLGEGYRCCRDCGQDWWLNIKYDLPFLSPRIDSVNEHIYTLIDEITTIKSQLTEANAQESKGMDTTIDQMLSKDIAVKWGLDEHGHKRNVQHIFMRCCQAINDLETENRQIESLRKDVIDSCADADRWEEKYNQSKAHLQKYGGHEIDCHLDDPSGVPCNCGWVKYQDY